MPGLPSSYYTGGFIQILHHISEQLIQCDSGTTIAELFNDEFDDLDFELALTCFEATHKLGFNLCGGCGCLKQSMNFGVHVLGCWVPDLTTDHCTSRGKHKQSARNDEACGC